MLSKGSAALGLSVTNLFATLFGVVSASDPIDKLSLLEPDSITYLENAWATNTINTVIFRHHGVISKGHKQFAAFYGSPEALVVVRRDLLNGSVERAEIEGAYNTDDAHNAISLGIDSEGIVHLAYDHHNTRLRYRRTREPRSVSEWTGEREMTGSDEKMITYPTFIRPRGDSPLLFLYRKGRSGRGSACLKEYWAESESWRDIQPCVFSGANNEPWTSNPYWNRPSVGPNGQVHMAVVWRTHAVGAGNERVNNIDIDYAVSGDNGKKWESSRGRQFRLPITQVNAETVLAVSPGSNLINQSSMAVDSKGYPHIVFYSDDPQGIPQYQHLWFDGLVWNRDYISERTESFDLVGGGTLQIPISRPEIVIDSLDRVYVVFRGDLTGDRMSVQRLLPPEYVPEESETRVLWNEPLGFAEPVVDKARWDSEEVLSMLIQWNGQPPHDTKVVPKYTPIYIVDWNLTTNWENYPLGVP